MKKVVHAVCPHDCPDACGVLVTVDDGKATSRVDVARLQEMDRIAAAVSASAGPAIAAATGAAPSHGALTAEARAIVEKIAWEVVPELAETIIREEIKRLLASK
jgi:hypothetical protein